jgi:hypothetical protein
VKEVKEGERSGEQRSLYVSTTSLSSFPNSPHPRLDAVFWPVCALEGGGERSWGERRVAAGVKTASRVKRRGGRAVAGEPHPATSPYRQCHPLALLSDGDRQNLSRRMKFRLSKPSLSNPTTGFPPLCAPAVSVPAPNVSALLARGSMRDVRGAPPIATRWPTSRRRCRWRSTSAAQSNATRGHTVAQGAGTMQERIRVNTP